MSAFGLNTARTGPLSIPCLEGLWHCVDRSKTTMAPNVGSRLGDYDVTALIGEGGMGPVSETTGTKLNAHA